MRVWRICTRKYAAEAFTGKGAELYAGRWNPAGVRMVYTSTSLALAAMEFFVHLDPAAASKNLVSMSASLPDGIRVDHIEVNRLPTDWKLVDRDDLQQMGADWLSSNNSVALEVPSAVIAGEWNVLLNPRHPDFNNVVIADPEPFVFDPRMFK